MERLSSFALFISVIIYLTLTFSECLISNRISEKVSVHNFNRERRSVEPALSRNRVKRQIAAEANHCDKSNAVVEKLEKDKTLQNLFIHESELTGDSKGNLQLAWTGKDYEKILIVTSDNGDASMYISKDNGLSFENKTSILGGSLVGKEVVVVKHPNDSKIVYIVAGAGSDYTMFGSLDGAETFWQKSIPFVISGITFHPSKSNLVLATDDTKKKLHLSNDSGKNWKEIYSNVFDVKWSTTGSDDIYVLTNSAADAFFGIMLTNGVGKLEKTVNFGETWTTLMEDIHSFGMEGKFLYCSKYVSSTSRDERNLMVSTDNGKNWNRARVPTITPDRFYSIVDSSDGVIMLHVDNPGDTGHGTLYISDATGIVFSESLKHHLYPNYEDLTDFYKVQSQRGVYITSVIDDDQSIHTMITYNGGAEWRPIDRPYNVKCEDESKKCNLQIHNLYSIKRNIRAFPPLSIPNAAGLILVHGHVADSIQQTNPDVYVSSDGGYNWNRTLEGPHHYQIADHGGFMVAVPADTDTPDTIRFSTDSGHCWGSYKYTNHSVVFTGLIIEPGNRVMTVAIWGYTATDRQWHTFVVNFTAIIDQACQPADYENFTAIDHNKQKACVLGSKQTIKRVRDDRWCYNGRNYTANPTDDPCECTREDYYCDFGYRRAPDDTCVKDPTFTDSDLGICYRGHEHNQVFLGYHRIPGNKCANGYVPDTKEVDLNVECSRDYVKNRRDDNTSGSSKTRSVLVGILILSVAIVIIIVTNYIAKKYKVYRQAKVAYRYSSIRCEDADEDAALDALRRNTSLYDNSSDESDLETTSVVSKAGNTGVRRSKTATNEPNGKLPNGHTPASGQVNVQTSPKPPVSGGKANGGQSKSVIPHLTPASSQNRGLIFDTDDELIH